MYYPCSEPHVVDRGFLKASVSGVGAGSGGRRRKEGNFVVNERSVLAYPKKKFLTAWQSSTTPTRKAKATRRDAISKVIPTFDLIDRRQRKHE
jgi:hypothetical protein